MPYDIYFEMRLYFVCLLCTNFAFWPSTESVYSIKKTNVKSYLSMEFLLVNELIFPRHLKLNLSVDNDAGLLLYSIDANKNQLVVGMSGADKNLLVQVMGGKEEKISLKRLCRCELCLFIHLLLEMGMSNSTFWIKCNGGSQSVVSFNWSNRTLAKGYQTLKHKEGNRSSSANSADLYFIDYPNNSDAQQIQGCIFDIEYNGQSIINNMNIVGNGITRGCNQSCSSEKCNGGVCLYSYVGVPFCNCTEVFGNGNYCVDVSRMVNRRYTETFKKFVGIKLSWRSSRTILWQMGNNSTQLTVTVTVDYLRQLLTLTDSQRNHEDKETLLTNYTLNESYVLILRPYKTIPHKKVNNVTVIYAKYSGLKDEDAKYDYMILSSCDGVIDVAVLEKEDDIEWNRLKLNEIDSSPYNCIDANRNQPKKERDDQNQPKEETRDENQPNSAWQLHSTLAISVIVAIIIIGIIRWIFRKHKKKICYSPIHIAARKGHLDEVKSLMKVGADVNAVDKKGRTPLHYAAVNGHLQLVEHLLKKDTTINVMGEHHETAKCLNKNIIGVNAKDKKNRTALHLAAGNGRLDVVKFLTEKGANVNIKDAKNLTPVEYAEKNGHKNVEEYLRNWLTSKLSILRVRFDVDCCE